MGLLEDEEYRRSQKQSQKQQAVLTLFKLLFILASLIGFCLMLLVVTLEAGGVDLLAWIGHHPALSARYKPHHWTTRLLAWAIVLLFLHTAWHRVSIFAKRLSLWWKVWREPSRKEMDNQETIS